jgi:hypothetical protein
MKDDGFLQREPHPILAALAMPVNGFRGRYQQRLTLLLSTLSLE